MQNQRFEALSRMCLNNWHYISRKVLSFNQEINFFTGHSGSGKSTVLDALQIILYANTDGRGFFNKAAADDSDRNLIEYLRGMVNIGENNEFAYLRNQNFSSTIVLELERTDTNEKQCVGIVFDVETATNEINRLFFWHKGGLIEGNYRTEKRVMTIEEVKRYLTSHFDAESYYLGSSNERFRKQLYDIYLGGLDSEKFPVLFKRAIPFRMNIKLEDFVKEYICMEQDIQIEDMQESVMQYGRMRKKIEDTLLEIHKLEEIQKQYGVYKEKEDLIDQQQYVIKRMEILAKHAQVKALLDKMKLVEQEIATARITNEEESQKLKKLKAQKEELTRQIAATGYEEMKAQLASINDLLERLNTSKGYWDKTATKLQGWEEEEITSNAILWDIEKFTDKTISEGELERLQNALADTVKDVKNQRREANKAVENLENSINEAKVQLSQLHLGKKVYPRELEAARLSIKKKLDAKYKRPVSVEILADLLDIRDETWRNAVEGYLGSQKMSIMVEPEYAEAAMKAYEELDGQKYFRVAVVDTQKVLEANPVVEADALSKEVVCKEKYIRAYVDYLLGRVIKCHTVEELRECRIGITPECLRYQGYRLQYINPDNYTKYAYIGEQSLKRQIRLLEGNVKSWEEELNPQKEIVTECNRILSLEDLSSHSLEEYLYWQRDYKEISKNEKEKERLIQKLQQMKEFNVQELERQQDEVKKAIDKKENLQKELDQRIWKMQSANDQSRDEHLRVNEELLEMERVFEKNEAFEPVVQEELSKERNPRYHRIGQTYEEAQIKTLREKDIALQRLQDSRFEYLRQYPNRGFSPTSRENTEYDHLLDSLQCDDLLHYQEIAKEQAKTAVEHFKDDFVFKIRSAIRDALQRKDELNRVISKLDFGKDKYQFIITKNKGVDGKYYDMFMDDALEINPNQIANHMQNQLDLFTMEHEHNYEDEINELIQIFIPADNASQEELEESKRNMDKYADYRTYLSFDMQQIIQGESGEDTIRIRLSRMIKKNSGGEGQNPLYVALLASFAQAYRINLSPKIQRNPTIRLVVLDEAFSKMDSEKVASCIELIRGLGFQAIISATNDKIQNYLENVDKTFVFANPNKKNISIQEFEKKEFGTLNQEIES